MRSLIWGKNTLEDQLLFGEENNILATRKGKAPSENRPILVNPDESQSVASGSHDSGVGVQENDDNVEKKAEEEEEGEGNKEEEEKTEKKKKVVFSSRNLRISGLSSTTRATDLKVKRGILGSEVLLGCHSVQYSLGSKFQTDSEDRSSELAQCAFSKHSTCGIITPPYHRFSSQSGERWLVPR